MWLEIDGETIIGIHSDQCDNGSLWVEYEGDDANLEDKWKDGKLVPNTAKKDVKKTKRREARAHITTFYPEWKQLNILREGDDEAIQTMGRFIDACRDWSNDPDATLDQLHAITP